MVRWRDGEMVVVTYRQPVGQQVAVDRPRYKYAASRPRFFERLNEQFLGSAIVCLSVVAPQTP